MALIDVVQQVCQVVGVEQLSTVFGNLPANRTQQEMLALANEMAQRIAYDTREWTALKVVMTQFGDGASASFPLPANYRRMLLSSNVWRTSTPAMPMRFFPDTDEWLQRRARNYSDSRGEWTMYGGQIHIVPTLAVGDSVMTPYLDKNPVALSAPGGGFGERFVADNDAFRLDERLLKLGMIWQWKANKGSPYAEDMASYETALARAAGADEPAPIIVDGYPISQSTNATVAYPWPVPTP